MSQNAHLQQRFDEQTQELHVHQVELEQQNEELHELNVELELSRNQYADLFEFAPVGYVVCDAAGLIQQINRVGCEQLGTVRPHLVGRHFSLFVGEGQREAFVRLVQTALLTADPGYDVAEGRSHRMELTMVRQDGSPWDAQLQCTGLAEQRRPGVRLVLTDISDLKTSQRETERYSERTRQVSEELQTFLYSMTHDLTRPLRQVEGFAKLLGQSLKAPDEKSASHLKHLLMAASQMGALTISLTRFFQSGQPIRRRQALDLNRMLELILHDLKPEWRGRQLQFTHDPLPIIQADPMSMQMVFTALISNAVKFTRPREHASIHVGVQEEGEKYLFSVRDNGVGFDSQQSGRLFGAFQRLHSEREFEGQGLGLALARRIVQRSQGQIWAESIQGQGSVFWVRLPRTSAAAQDDPEPTW